jgi:threonine synthase
MTIQSTAKKPAQDAPSFEERATLDLQQREYLTQQLQGRPFELVATNELRQPGQLAELVNKLKTNPSQSGSVLVLSYGVAEITFYQEVLSLLNAKSFPDAFYGLTYDALGRMALHDCSKGCFIGFRDVRSPDGSFSLLEPSNHFETAGYEFLVPSYDLRLVKEPHKLLEARGWRDYLPVLPLKSVRLDWGESTTPFFSVPGLAKKLGLASVSVKDESRNPTGSQKDRQTFIQINRALEDGIEQVNINSSGNAALSAAAYARRAGIACVAVVPKETSASKKALLNEFGARVIERSGNYEENHRWLIEANLPGRNISPGVTALGLDGIKLIAYELVSQGFDSSVVIVPAANGSLLAGLFKGFSELKELGLLNEIPKICAVQVAGGAPLKEALARGEWHSRIENPPASSAEAIIAEESFSSPPAIEALRETGGCVVEVTDQEIKKWQQDLRRLYGIVSELSSAAAFAALPKLCLEPKTRVTVINTASGYKDLLAELNFEPKAMAIAQDKMGTHTLRKLNSLADYAAAEQLQRQAFGYSERELVSSEMLGIINSTGGLVIGAFDRDQNMIAFCSGLLAQDKQGVYLHSDLAAVKPDLQSGGVGFDLKLAQGEYALQMGIDRICWTYDPMLTKNANLNIKKLGATAIDFERDVYGESSGKLAQGLPTHRLFVEWRPASKSQSYQAEAELPVALKSNKGIPQPLPYALSSRVISVEVPQNFLSIKASSLELARLWQEAFASVAEQLFKAGYLVKGFERRAAEGIGVYLFEKP